jgi:DNA-directed RNA polymerase specialized sigma24 family protein
VNQNQHGRPPRSDLSIWERKLAFAIARKFELHESEELQAELTRTILDLKTRPPPTLRNWKAYLAKALHNRADTWTRRRRATAKKEFTLPDLDQETASSFAAEKGDDDLRLAFAELWRELDPDLQRFWHFLAEEQGNQAKVARRLGRHRNTIRAWIRKIQDLLARHQFSAHEPTRKKTIGSIKPPPDKSIAISGRLLQKLTRTRLNGTQLRILLWIILSTFRRKQKIVPFNYRRIAEDLSLDRRGVSRAAKTLAMSHWIFLEAGRAGLKRD